MKNEIQTGTKVLIEATVISQETTYAVLRTKSGERFVIRLEELTVCETAEPAPTPSFKAGQEVWKPEDSCEWDMPQPNRHNIIKGNGIIQAICGGMAWVNDQEGDFHTIPLEDLRRPIPAQPTVESELDSQEFYELMQQYRLAPVSNQAEVGGCFKIVKSWLMAWHQKHSGRVEVSVPSDEDKQQMYSAVHEAVMKVRIEVYKFLGKDGLITGEVDTYFGSACHNAASMAVQKLIHFMTRKEAGNGI